MTQRLREPLPHLAPERLAEAALADPPMLEKEELRHCLRCEACLDAWADAKDAAKALK